MCVHFLPLPPRTSIHQSLAPPLPFFFHFEIILDLQEHVEYSHAALPCVQKSHLVQDSIKPRNWPWYDVCVWLWLILLCSSDSSSHRNQIMGHTEIYWHPHPATQSKVQVLISLKVPLCPQSTLSVTSPTCSPPYMEFSFRHATVFPKSVKQDLEAPGRREVGYVIPIFILSLFPLPDILRFSVFSFVFQEPPAPHLPFPQDGLTASNKGSWFASI